MAQTDVDSYFDQFYSEFLNLADISDEKRPLYLAHYTSLNVIEKIVQSNELWFSNPLFMNDYQEVRFGVLEGQRCLEKLVEDQSVTELVGGRSNINVIIDSLRNHLEHYVDKYLRDIYVFCLSEYDAQQQPDGRLSMWRGYGANGQGAALVFKTNFVTITPSSPLFIAKVQYAHTKERIEWMTNIIHRCIGVLKSIEINKEKLLLVGYHIFYIMLYYSLLSKHPGFEEEQEWRLIYFPDRDTRGLLHAGRSYFLRNNTIEPKLRFPIEPLNVEPRGTWTFENILERIVLGPTHASPLAVNSAKRMLETLGKPELAKKIWVSEIPYRPLSS